MSKRGQVTIWVVIAILLVASMSLFFFVERNPEILGSDEINPDKYVQDCIKPKINDLVDEMLPKGGFLDDRNTKMYNNINVSYLCLNKGNYKPCVQQHPAYIDELKQEIKANTEDELEACFEDLIEGLEKKGKNVKTGETNYEISFGPKRIYVDIEKELVIDENFENLRYEEFSFEILNPIYDLALVAMEISKQEAAYCYFEYVGYMILFPRFDIKKYTFTEGTKIYTIKDKYSDKELNIATRSCAIPPGI